MSDLPRVTQPAASPPDAATVAQALQREQRARYYVWLSDLFAAPPRQDIVASYRRGEAAAWLDEVAKDSAMVPGVERVRDSLATTADDATLTSMIATEYCRLFVGVGGPQTIPPYESAHRHGGRLFQAPVSEMAALLEAHGVSVAAGCAEPPDHLSIELALMARLVGSSNPAQATLFERLSGWVPNFCELCVRSDKLGFWAGAALLLAAVLETEITESIPKYRPDEELEEV